MSERKKGETFKDGFVYAGEFRKPKPNEWFVSTRIVAFPLAEDVAVQNTPCPNGKFCGTEHEILSLKERVEKK